LLPESLLVLITAMVGPSDLAQIHNTVEQPTLSRRATQLDWLIRAAVHPRAATQPNRAANAQRSDKKEVDGQVSASCSSNGYARP
jgi:hypothetical protein